MSRFIDELERLVEAEINAENAEHPMWPHGDIRKETQERMERMAQEIFQQFGHPVKTAIPPDGNKE